MARRNSSTQIGRNGEKLAASALEARGYQIVELNWRCTGGEIDLVAWDGDELVFVEVKTRHSIAFGLPEDAVTPAKKRRLLRCGLIYSFEHNLMDTTWRIDLVSIVLTTSDQLESLQIHRNAVYDDQWNP
jgi:putative endonuclease